MLHSSVPFAVPFAAEACGYMGKAAVRFMNCLGEIVAERQLVSNAHSCAGSALGLLWCTCDGGMLRCAARVG